MKIDVRGLIGSAGEQRVLDLVVPVPVLAGEAEGLFSPASVRLVVTSTPEGILAVGEAKAIAHLECSRCLVQFDYPAQGQLEHLFINEAPSTGPALGDKILRAGEIDEREWSDTDASADEDLDMSPIQDGMIDIGPLVREVLALALPMKPLCRENCPGLCPGCGKPLNDGPCGCEVDVIDPRLAALARAFRVGGVKHDVPAEAEQPKDKKE
ncbi:MAG: DUF177 domain-containing protein [Desulfobacterales bacterium]